MGRLAHRAPHEPSADGLLDGLKMLAEAVHVVPELLADLLADRADLVDKGIRGFAARHHQSPREGQASRSGVEAPRASGTPSSDAPAYSDSPGASRSSSEDTP